jgi:hypothetical protein
MARNRIRTGLRLEQETIGFSWVERYRQQILYGCNDVESPAL